MPIHVVEKKIPYMDESGSLVKPDAPNGYKFETLVLDMAHDGGLRLRGRQSGSLRRSRICTAWIRSTAPASLCRAAASNCKKRTGFPAEVRPFLALQKI